MQNRQNSPWPHPCPIRGVNAFNPSSWQTFKYGKLGEVIENIRTFALPFESQTYTFKMEYEYDPFNRIQSILYPDSELVEYSYNLGGMLSKVTGSVTRKVTDLVGPMQMHGGSLLPGGDELMGGGAVSGDISGNDPFFIPTETIRYSYIDSIVYNKFELKDSVVYGNGTRVRYVYDSLQRLTALRSYTADDELMQDIAYHYDSVGNILDIENSAAALGNGLGGTYRQEYTYDNLYRLTHATGWWECRPDHLTLRDTVDMRYSKNGRIIRKQEYAETFKNSLLNLVRYDRQYQYSSPYSNKLGSVTGVMPGANHQFGWDGCGNMVRHDNPEQGYDRRLSWTEDNRLQFVKDNGSTGAYYQYDAGGDRTYKLLYHKTTGSLNGVQTDYYTLDDATLYVSPYLVVTPQGYTKHYYAETERITTQLGKYRFAVVDSCVAGDSLAPMKLQNAAQAFPTDSFPTPTPMLGYLHSLVSKPKAVSTLYFYHPDHLGSASWITNIYGRTIQHLYYLPWGEDFVNQRTGSFSSMYTFSAKEKDTETGYSYFGARYYSSDLSIWLSVDPMSDKYPSLSPYVYCANNPVKLVDPNGEDVWKPDGKGGWIAQARDNAWTLHRDAGISFEKAIELMKAQGFVFTDNDQKVKVQVGDRVQVSEPSYNKYDIPYRPPASGRIDYAPINVEDFVFVGKCILSPLTKKLSSKITTMIYKKRVSGYTGHAAERMATRGFSQSDVTKIVVKGERITQPGRYGTTQTLYKYGGNTVIVNDKSRKIITLYGLPKEQGGFLIPFK